MASRVHPTAIVDPRAELGQNIELGPYAIVGGGVQLGDGCVVHAHAVLAGPARIGAGCQFFPFSVTGSAAQHKRPQTVTSRLVMGEANVVREHVTIHCGTDGNDTRIGDRNLFMVSSHVAHDVTLGSHITLANGVQLAGHVTVEDHAVFGGLAAIGQFVRIGESAFVAGGSMVERDVPPFVIVQGDRARVRALNEVGLERRNVAESSRAALREAFRVLYTQRRPRAQALRSLPAELAEDALVAKLVAALTQRK